MKCEWCGKRRKRITVKVQMERYGYRPNGHGPVIFRRYWALCSQCRDMCERQLKTAFRKQPE